MVFVVIFAYSEYEHELRSDHGPKRTDTCVHGMQAACE